MNRYIFMVIVAILLFILSYNPVEAQFQQTVQIQYLDAEQIRQGLLRVIARSQEVYGTDGGGMVGDYVEGTITAGPGSGLVFREITAELIMIEGDTTNPNARLYMFTPFRDRETNLTLGQSELVDNYRVRVNRIDVRRQEVDITIRQAGTVQQYTGRGLHPPGRVHVTADRRNSTVTIYADYQIDLHNLLLWVQLWDRPEHQHYRPAPGIPQPVQPQRQQQDQESIAKAQYQAYLEYREAYEAVKARYDAGEISFDEFDAERKRLERERNQRLIESYMSPPLISENQ